VLHAIRGFKKLTEQEIEAVYGSPPVYKHLKWPESPRNMEKVEGAHWVTMTYFDACKIPIICQVVHLIDEGKIVGKTYFDFAKDINTLTMSNYVHFTADEVLPIATYGGYFPPVIAEPLKYIQA